MNCKMVATASLGLAIGLVAWSSLRQSEAQGQVGQEKHGVGVQGGGVHCPPRQSRC